MPTKEHLLNQVDLIADRRRNEPGGLHPFRKHRLTCKGCGKEIGIIERNLLPEGNYCQQCRGKHDKNWIQKITDRAKNRSPEWRQTKTDQNKALAKDPNWIDAVQKGVDERGKDPDFQKKISAGLQGCSLKDFPGFRKDTGYCRKWKPSFRDGVRFFHGNRCALCGYVWQPGNPQHSVHHIHNRKDSCCSEDAPRAFVLLCSTGCHQRTSKHWRRYVERFTRHNLKNFNGKSYYTLSEWRKIRNSLR